MDEQSKSSWWSANGVVIYNCVEQKCILCSRDQRLHCFKIYVTDSGRYEFHSTGYAVSSLLPSDKYAYASIRHCNIFHHWLSKHCSPNALSLTGFLQACLVPMHTCQLIYEFYILIDNALAFHFQCLLPVAWMMQCVGGTGDFMYITIPSLKFYK